MDNVEYTNRIIDRLEHLGVDVNNGTQDVNTVEAYKIDLNNPICPCCGKKLKPIHKNVETDGFIGESKLNERWENEYLTNKILDVAYELYDNELLDVEPTVDNFGNPTVDYLERFKYCSPELKNAVRRAATKLSNDLKDDGFNINPWYCEVEIYDALRMFSK